MAGQADGSIIIDTELSTNGFKAGSTELHAAIKSLSNEMKDLKSTLTELFSKPFTPEINTSSTVQKATDLQREIDAVNTSVGKLEPTFQKAMSGSESAMNSFEAKAYTLSGRIAELQECLDRVGQTKYPTQEYEAVYAEAEKAEQTFDALLARQEKMQAMGVSENSAQWKSLQYDMELVSNKYHELIALKQQLEASGNASQLGADTSAYAQMEATLSAASARLDEMRASTGQSEGFMRRLASSAGRVASFIGRAAASAAGALVSGIRSAASHMAKMLLHSKSMKGQFNGLISGAKKFTLSLLGARGIYALLRKAVSAYMSENEELSNKLKACWSGIGNALGPIITKLINLVAKAVAYVNAFLKLFGVLGKTTAKSGSKAAKAAKNLKRQLASFDELNVLNDNSDSSGGDDSAGSLPDVSLPDWAREIADQIKAGDWQGAAHTLAEKLNSTIASVDWEALGRKAGYYLNGALTFLATFIKDFDWLNLGKNFATGINGILNTVDWTNLGTVLSGKFRAALLTAAGFLLNLDWEALAKAFSDFAIGFFNGIAEAIAAVDWAQLGRNIATFLRSVNWGGIAEALFGAIGAALGGLSAFLLGLIEHAWQSVVDWWYNSAYKDGQFSMEGLLLGIGDALANIAIWIYDHIFKPFVDGFKRAFGIHSPSTVMSEQGGFIIDGLKQGLLNRWGAVTGFFSSKLTEIKNTITGQGWSGVGSNICNGISSGIDAGWQWLTNKVRSVATGLLDSAKAALGIHSPSKLFRDKIGMNIGLGIGEGVENSEISVLKSVAGVADAIASEINAGDYSIKNLFSANAVSGTMNSFSDKVVGSLNTLLDRLQAIAENVVFSVPSIVNGAIPYAMKATQESRTIGEATNAAVSQAFEASVYSAVLNALRDSQSDADSNRPIIITLNDDVVARAVFDVHNSIVKQTGVSPLYV